MSWITKMWYQGAWYQWFFWPLSWLFGVLSGVRRLAYKLGAAKSQVLPVPVVVVGNISVGGNGKTPVVIALCEALLNAGFRVGVVSRGYGAQKGEFPRDVLPDSRPQDSGDEPLLIARRLKIPVVIDPVRPRGAERLVSAHACNVIISDDGLQHYALARDIELVVTDKRLFGNGFLQPMGPLREGLWRLQTVDAVIFNQRENLCGVPTVLAAYQPVTMTLITDDLVNVKHPHKTMSLAMLSATRRNIAALAGIGDPTRFFDQLESMGVSLSRCIALPDHHALEVEDIPSDTTVIMTEKDAVKSTAFAHDDCWYQPVSAQLPAIFYSRIIEQLRRKTAA